MVGRDLRPQPLLAGVAILIHSVTTPYARVAFVARRLGQHVAEDPVEPGAPRGRGLRRLLVTGPGHAQSPSCSARSAAAAICSGVFGFFCSPCPGTLPALIESPVNVLASGSSLAICSHSRVDESFQ